MEHGELQQGLIFGVGTDNTLIAFSRSNPGKLNRRVPPARDALVRLTVPADGQDHVDDRRPHSLGTSRPVCAA